MTSDVLSDNQGVIPLTPSTEDWLTPNKLSECHDLFESSSAFLKQAGLWKASLKYWVRKQVASEASCMPETSITNFEKLEEQWLKTNSLEECSLSPSELRAKLSVGPLIAIWSRAQWGHRLNHLFLQRKNVLDMVTCWFITVPDKNLAQEIYHQLKASEITFQHALDSLSSSGVSVKGAQLKKKPLGRLPEDIVGKIKSLTPGKICMPMRTPSGFCIIRLEQYLPASLDRNTEEMLLAEQFSLWSETVVTSIDSEFTSPESQV